MGGHGGWVQSSGFFPNGLLPNESTSVTQMLDPDRWSQAEERTAELIARIQPNQPSEERRQAVASYVQRLITKCFSCQVFTFGSVPLKTYLPDGDIDLTTFSKNHNLKDNWANEVQDMLKREEKSEDAEFRVKEVQYIQAEVKIIKCLVENIVVDISFNQLGGLCTLCFLEEVNHLISQNHLFKRSVILIKAWCYYESRILGAHHGLISTYALETLVLYIFHVYNNSFSGPLEVLYRFLEFFSKFDWDNFCVSLWGPVPICSLPDMTGKPPRKDGGKLLLTKKFLNDCSSVYAVFPGGLENQEQPFVSKHFNVIDPLRTNNNLGRSVSKGNFFRIRSAFAFGAQRLARLLDCPKENLLAEVNQFFSNTWDRHGKGHRPDAPSLEVYASRSLNMSQIGGSDLLRNDSNSKAKEKGASYDSEADLAHLCQGLSAQHINHSIQKSRTDNIGNELHAMYQFARTHSSPELTDPCTGVLSRGRHNGVTEAGKGQTACTGLDNSKRRNSKPESSLSCNTELSNCSIDASNAYYGESGLHCRGKEHLSVAETMQMHQEAQDLVNMMASSAGYSFNGQVHVPVNLASVHPTHPLPPSILPSLGYSHRNPNIPSFESSWMHYTQDLVSLAGSQYFPYLGMTSYREELTGTAESNLVPTELKSDDNHHGFWAKQGAECPGYDHININSRARQLKDMMQQFTSSSSENSPFKDHGEKFENSSLHQRNRETDVYTTTSSSSVPSQVSSSRTSSPSASNMDGLTSKSLKPTRDRRGLKAVPSTDPTVYVSESVDHTSSQADHDNQEWVSLSTIGTEVQGYESAPLCGSRLLGSASGQKAKDNNVNLPFTFYPTGPPIPFLTMLPLYNLPTETGNATASTNYFDKDEDINSSHKSKLDHGLDLTDKLGQAIFNRSSSVNGAAFVETSECKSQILNGDFTSHWQNLQYGRLCQNPQQHGSFLYPTINAVPPVYLKEQFLYDGLGKPPSGNVDLLTQLLSYSPSLIPISSLQPSCIGPAGVYQPYADEIPRYRAGTGTYLPNPKFSSKDRHQSSHSRNHRGNNGYDRKDHHGDREGNWNTNTKSSRFTSRGQGRNQSEKPSMRTDRSTPSNSRFNKPFQPDPFPSYQSRNGSFGYSNSTNHGSSASSGYGMYQLPLVNPALISPSGTSLPYDQNVSYISPADLLDLGSLRAMQFSGLNEGSRLGEGSSGVVNEQWNFVGGSAHSSPDHPSSTEHHRSLGPSLIGQKMQIPECTVDESDYTLVRQLTTPAHNFHCVYTTNSVSSPIYAAVAYIEDEYLERIRKEVSNPERPCLGGEAYVLFSCQGL